MRPGILRALLLPAVFLPVLTGCYRYTPIEPVAVEPGTSIRARVSAAEAERIALLIGTGNSRLIQGVLVEGGADGLMVQVPTVLRAGSGETLNQRIVISRSGLLELELRRLDRTRTWGLVALGLLAGGFVTYQAVAGEPRITGPDNNGGGGVEARIPVRLLIPCGC